MHKPQSYKNHRRYVRLYHVYGWSFWIITFIGSIVNVLQSWGDHSRLYNATLITALCLLVALAFLFARGFALRAQDRLILLEERLRFIRLTGHELHESLRASQIIALRFASDDELPELAQRAAQERLTADSIKRAIKHWKADRFRV